MKFVVALSLLALAAVAAGEAHVSFYSDPDCSESIVSIASQECVNAEGEFGDFEFASLMGMIPEGYPMVLTYARADCVGAPDQSIMVPSDKCHTNTKHPEFTFNDLFVASVDSVEE